MEKILTQFGVNPILLLAQIINFLVLLFILNKLMYKPLLSVLQKRKDIVADSIKNAEEIELKLQKTEEERLKALDKAAEEAKNILLEAQASASQVIADAHTKAASDIEVMMQKGADMIKLEREKMETEMKGELSNIVTIALEKLSTKAFDSKDHKKMVDDAVKSL